MMPISYQDPVQLSCPECGADFEASVWLVLDAQEQPEAVVSLRQGVLNMVACPKCGARGPAGAPVLFHDSELRRVIFSAAPGSEEHEIREQARELHALLVGSIPEDRRGHYLTDVEVTQDLAGLARLLERYSRRQRKPAAPAPAAPAAPPKPAPARVPTDAPNDPLLIAVQALLAANSVEEMQAIVAQHPILLEPSTDSALEQLGEVAANQREPEIAQSLRRVRLLLAQMGQKVIEPLPPVAPVSQVLANTPISAIPEPVLTALLAAPNIDAIADLAAQNPLLLRPEVDGLLNERAELAIDVGDERLALALEERREALEFLRSKPPADMTAPGLEEAIEALLLADGEEAMARVIDAYPMLLGDDAAQALWQFAAEARAGGDEEMARLAVECRELLRRVREGLED